jgi:serine/threonine-protein kinase
MAHPETLGKYTIKTLLGEGAMGVVYKAFDPGIGRLVALKTIRRALSQDRHAETSLADRFRNEARAVGRINHPGIVAIYELGQDGDNAFIAMEYVEGRDLSHILADNPSLPEADVLQVMLQLLDALECAHQQGVWHRDIKPANLIITTTGQLKVTDFGIARIETAALTMVTSTIGTPGYMAPEQYIGESFDHRVDLFASGVLLYRMLAGQAPFTGSPEAVMYGIMTKDAPSLSAVLPADAAAFYDPIVARALAKDPAQRYPSAAAFREALRQRNSAVAGTTGETTIIVHAASNPAHQPAASPGAGRQTSGLTNQTQLTHWEEATLAPVQAALARFMGPMAKVLVRQAAKKCTELPDLVSLVIQDIPSPQDRARFLEMLQHQTGSSTLGSGAQALRATGGVTGSQAKQALAAPLIERATLVMTRHMGPIAKIIVKKAAAKAASAEQFVALLAQELPEGPQRTQLIAELS